MKTEKEGSSVDYILSSAKGDIELERPTEVYGKGRCRYTTSWLQASTSADHANVYEKQLLAPQ